MRQHLNNLGLTAVALAALSCGGAAAPPPGAADGAPIATPPLAAAPTQAPSAGQDTDEAPVTPAAAPPPPSFSVVAALEDGGRLFAVDGALLLAPQTSRPSEQHGLAIPIAVVEHDKPVYSPGHEVPGLAHLVTIAGSWPDAIDVLATGDTGRTGIAMHLSLGKRGFSPGSARTGAYYRGAARRGSSVVALEAPAFLMTSMPRIVTLRGPTLRYTPQKAPAGCRAESGFPLPATLFPAGFGATGAGTLVAYGSDCEGKSAVEMWTEPGKPSTITQLPDVEPVEDALVLPGVGDTAWLVTGALVFFDGSRWAQVQAPDAGAPVYEAAVAPDGSLWAITAEQKVYSRRGDAWRAEPLPEGVKPDSIAVTSDGTVWLSSATALLRTGDVKHSPQLAKQERAAEPSAASKPARRRGLVPGSPACDHNLVVLYAFTKVTPADYDFPLTRKAVKGHTELTNVRFVVTEDMGRRFFTAMVPDFKTGQQLVKIIEKGVQGSKPQVVCAQPEVQRELRIDLATGEVQN